MPLLPMQDAVMADESLVPASIIPGPFSVRYVIEGEICEEMNQRRKREETKKNKRRGKERDMIWK